jgi:hypothetical protein
VLPEEFCHCYEAGVKVLTRFREWDRKPTNQNRDLIELEDRIAHYGCALAHASIIRKKPKNSPERAWYKLNYGMGVVNAWRGRGDQDFVAVLNWHSCMKNMIKDQLMLSDTVFNKRFKVLKLVIEKWVENIRPDGEINSKGFLEYLRKVNKGNEEYFLEMKNCYEVTYEQHRGKLKADKDA